MFQVRPAYVPPIFVSRARHVGIGARVGAESVVDVESLFKGNEGFPLAFVGQESSAPPTISSTTKILQGLYLAPFIAGPPAVGYLLFGTLGAVGGAIFAAPAIYLYVDALKRTS